MSLSNKVVLVSGANRGIGAAVVHELLKYPVRKVYAGARNKDSLPDFGDARVAPLQLDVTDDASVRRAAEIAADVDVLVNNAGALEAGDWSSIPLDALDTNMATNFLGTYRVIRAFAPRFVSRGSGTIVNNISVVGLAAVPILAGYSASKAALHSLTQALRPELEKSGVKVLGIYPGPIDTDLAKGIPLAKATPQEAAVSIVQGLEKEQTYIFPDPLSLQVEQAWATNGRQLEAVMRLGG